MVSRRFGVLLIRRWPSAGAALSAGQRPRWRSVVGRLPGEPSAVCRDVLIGHLGGVVVEIHRLGWRARPGRR